MYNCPYFVYLRRDFPNTLRIAVFKVLVETSRPISAVTLRLIPTALSFDLCPFSRSN
jgi:hypothetical protein